MTDEIATRTRTITAQEIEANRRVIEAAGLVAPDTHFPYVGLVEADRRRIAAGEDVPRLVRSYLIDLESGKAHETVVEPGEQRLVSARELDPEADGQVPIVGREFSLVEEVVHEDRRWLAAMARRGLTDVSTLRVSALSAGVLAEHEQGRRIQRCFTFEQRTPEELGWAHPVDGVTVVVDVIAREVLEVTDHALLAVPDEDADYHLAAWRGPDRQGLKPIEIVQPEGPSFTIDDAGVVDWLGWRLQVAFDRREGLILRHVSIRDGERQRSVLARASIAEMVVPYGDPAPQRWFQNFFDGGEYLFGGYANSLELGCDCVGDITYLDAIMAGDDGRPNVVKQAICIHEEDAGVLWKHRDDWNGSSEVRRNRRLVVSFFMTVGNYDYGFFWYLGLDGSIQFEIKATGIVFTSGHPRPGYPFATEIAPGLGAPNHQHLFSARLDVAVDGAANAVDELEAALVPRGPENPSGTGFVQRATRLTTELGAQRDADSARGRIWRILSTEHENRMGQPTGYALFPGYGPLLLADADSDIAKRAAFTTKSLWVTAYEPDERYPAGDLVNMHPGGAGLTAWTAADRSVDGTDIVVWHTFGLTHFPRLEDWPVMPVDTTGFTLKPVGFFDRNPALDIPAPDHCAPGHHAGSGARQQDVSS